MIGYILISSGPKPSGDIESCRAARQQRNNLLNFAERATGERKYRYSFDHARNVRSLDDLPNLRTTLHEATERGNRVFIDSFLRLFSRCPRQERSALLEELQSYSRCFHDIHFLKLLSKIREIEKARLFTIDTPVNFAFGDRLRSPSKLEDRRHQTVKASEASQLARGAAADAKAVELRQLKKELSEVDKVPKLAALARIANERGLKTTRGNSWTVSAAQRALKRVSD